LKGRDLAIVAAVVLLGGFALADALRTSGDDTSAGQTQSVPDGRSGPEPQPDAPENWPAGRLRGTLVFTDARACRVRVIGLGGGRERPAGDLVTFCDLWAAPIGQRIAYSTGGVRGSAEQGFAVVDLRRAGVELASIQNIEPGGEVLWSPDAQRVAWCTLYGVGQELELGAERPRSLARCPIAYTPEGQLAFAAGRRLVVGDRTILVEERSIIQATWGADGSLLVVVGTGTVRRYDQTMRLTDAVDLSTGFQKLVPSPDNCAVAFFDTGQMRVEDVGCFRAPARAFIGLDAAWSPDGFWVAVAAPDQIEFHRVLGGEETIVWPGRAQELDWRGD
jgi:hypothetical protein